ncbi:hypothetical protein [Foetidibacter luteolus]|uniref:hypothetical protein n=1 Tax=Foetidibacter luteolus TaxID=2608880 RepID=UPI00129A835D|nr:hypothetical protein [Foetidibacter luteolus]
MKDHSFTGQRDIVLNLMKTGDHHFRIVSERNVYECERIVPITNKIDGKFFMANMKDAEIIRNMSYSFQQEEYGDRNDKNEKYMLERGVMPSIPNEIFFKWVDRGRIKSVLQLRIDKNHSPNIGHFFSDPTARNRGSGYAFFWNVTNLVLEKFTCCGLITKRSYEPSNSVFVKTGNKKIYDWKS